MNLADLRKPFPPAKISWRIGSTNQEKTKGMALAYLDARDVQDRLDEVCGLDGWQNRYVPMHDKKTVCEIGIAIQHSYNNTGPEWIWKSDGAGDSDIEAEKGALSDAFKRAAVKWGIGRYLYDLDSPWVAVEPAGRSFKIAAHEYKRLEALLAGNAPQTQAKAIHTPHTLPTAQEVTETTPQAWAQKAIDRLATFNSPDEITAFEDKYEAKIVLLAKSLPDMHQKLVAAIADRHFALDYK